MEDEFGAHDLTHEHGLFTAWSTRFGHCLGIVLLSNVPSSNPSQPTLDRPCERLPLSVDFRALFATHTYQVGLKRRECTVANPSSP